LDTPVDPVDDPEAMCGFAAVRLFCERAQTARRGFEITADNAEAVGRVCRRLDGLPLALELAAVRLNILDPEGLLRRLDDRFALLTGGVGDQVDRHRTLTATLEWSYDLLTAEEQTLLNRLSVFVGGFTLDAAKDVCAGGAIVPDRVLDLVSSLVDQSLIVPYQGAVGRRFRFLETVREYATGRLADSGEAELVAEHHATYFHRLVVDSFDLFWGPDDIMCLDRLDEEWPNISRALAWYVDERRSQDGLFMAGSLYRLAFRRHYETVTIAWLDRLLTSDATPSTARARALLGRASLELDGRHSMSLFQEAVGLCREFGSVLDLGAVLHNAVSSSMETGEWETARELVTELVSLEIVDPDSRSLDVTQQATMALQADANPVLALSLVEEGLDLARQSDSPERVADVLRLTAMICRYTGDLDRADDALREAAQLEAAIDHKQANVGATELFFAEVALDRSEPERAIEYLMEHARLVQPLADEDDASDSLIAQGLDVWGRAAIARERYVVAVTLLAAHAAYMQHWSLTNYPTFQAEINKALETARDRLDADSYQQAWERGSAMTIHDALAYAVEHLAPASAD
jgi:non-specific serine/threonine protein kinase